MRNRATPVLVVLAAERGPTFEEEEINVDYIVISFDRKPFFSFSSGRRGSNVTRFFLTESKSN
jgi:hypothetical protein